MTDITPEDRARAIGTEHGKNAASWVFDGNTTRETYARVLKGIEECDPMVMDAYREPNLSGEFADDYSLSDLARDLDIDQDSDDAAEALDECAIAYSDAASSAFWREIERMARYQLDD